MRSGSKEALIAAVLLAVFDWMNRVTAIAMGVVLANIWLKRHI